MNCIKRKCAHCGKDIVVQDLNDNENVHYDSRYYHKSCFVALCTNKTTKKWQMASQNIEYYINEANKLLSQIFNSRKVDIRSINQYIDSAQKVKDKIFAESDVNQFLREQYNVENLGYIYPQYLLKVYNGTYKYSSGIEIPPKHLLDMWQAKINQLNNIRARNIVLGKEMSVENRIAYDLAVIVKKYNSYLEWLHKQSVLENAQIISPNIPVPVINKRIVNEPNDDDNMDTILNEIFN